MKGRITSGVEHGTMHTDNMIRISWEAPEPSVQPNNWHYWDRESLAQPEEKELGSMGMPERCFHVVRLALLKSLPRFTGWEASEGLSLADKELLFQAAKIYKRGVAFRSSKKQMGRQDPRFRQRRGQYSVRLLTAGGQNTAPILFNKLIAQQKERLIMADEGLIAHYPELRSQVHLKLPCEEASKTPDTFAELYRSLCQHHRDKHSALIIGGGVATDTGAFAASMAGLPFTLVPSTLLAMVDACVGGKTGINIPPFGKNLAGHFAFPRGVFLFPHLLDSLPPREIRSGAAECLKHALISQGYTDLASLVRKLRNFSGLGIGPRLGELIRVKADIVSEDPYENGKRAILNFGHTLGHALEAVSHTKRSRQQAIRHGEAVAIGMLFAACLSTEAGYMKPKTRAYIAGQLKYSNVLPAPETVKHHLKLGLDHPELPMVSWPYILNDKKSESTSDQLSDWILLHEPGKIVRHNLSFKTPVSIGLYRKAWCHFPAIYKELFQT